VILDIVPDIFYKDEKYEPSSRRYSASTFGLTETGWHPAMDHAESTALTLEITSPPPDEFFSLMLSIGIRYGAMMNQGVIEQVRYAGSARVLAVV
jgi:hypothetical protein